MNHLYRAFFFEGWGRQLGRNILISGSLYALGDVSRQQIKGDGNGMVLDKTRRMAVVGCCIGVMDHFWYTALDNLYPSRALGAVFGKMILDQIVMAPACTSFFFLGKSEYLCSYVNFTYLVMTAMSRMEGKNKAACLNELQVKFWPTYKVSTADCLQ